MRQGQVYVGNMLAGIIAEEDQGYRFTYSTEYLARPDAEPVSLTLPLQSETFESRTLFPFFDGLIPEGWLLDIAVRNWKVRRHDRMALLLTCCSDCIGNISVVPIEEEVNHE